MARARILVCDDEPGLRQMLSVLLRREGYAVEVAAGVPEALHKIAAGDPLDLVVTDLVMPDGSGMTVLDAARARDEATQVVLITAYATTEQAVEAMRRGAYDYIQKPFKNHELLATVEKALEKRDIVADNRTLRKNARDGFRLGGLVGKSPAMLGVMQLVSRIASARTSVLLTGESGTGKELIARALHAQSDRKDARFVAVNCGALPENLMESELFGHEKGAFTGATARKEGLIRAAEGGTLFLDEVGELTPALQVKLLRVLQERKVRAVGGEKEIDVDVRVVAATNRDVEQDVAEGRFRQDLFYRLNVIRIHLPPLRERPEDIALLVEHFVAKHAALAGKRIAVAPEAMRWLVGQRFPGNVRELENAIERAITLAVGPRIERADLPDAAASLSPATDVSLPADGLDLDAYLGEIERRLLLQALERSSGVRTNAAKLLGTTFRSLRYRLAKYGLGDSDADQEPDAGDEKGPSSGST